MRAIFSHDAVLHVGKMLLVLSCAFSLSGCLVSLAKGGADLDGMDNRSYKKSVKKKGASLKSSKPGRTHVYAMRGLLGVFSTGMDKLAKQLNHRLDVPAVAMSYHEDNKLVNHLIKKKQRGLLNGPIILVGHSYGADTIVSVAQKLSKENIQVETLISIDNTKKDVVPGNVKRFYHIHSGASKLSQAVFGWGKSLAIEKTSTKHYDIDVTKNPDFKNINHFNIDDSQQIISYLLSIVNKTV
jgi:hypothetical protein